MIHKDRADEALAILAKYHGDGDVNSPLVQLQYREIMEDRANNQNKNPWWDYRELVNTRAARYRLAMVIAMAFFGQWSGNNVVSYFMPNMLKTAGITDTNKQLLFNAINPIFSLIASVYGATLLDKLGRRTMLMAGLTGALLCYVMLTAFTARSADNPNLAYGTRTDQRFDDVRNGVHPMAGKTHCIRGHEFTPDNTRVYTAPRTGKTHRFCRSCERDRRRKQH